MTREGMPVAAPDPALESYVAAIEGHLRARRGVEHILTPRDFALARAWCTGYYLRERVRRSNREQCGDG